MASQPTTTVTGVLVALTSDSYDFTDKATGERKIGSTVRAFVASDSGDRISECRVPETVRPMFAGVSMGTPVQIECNVNARVVGPQRAVTELSVVNVRVAAPAAK